MAGKTSTGKVSDIKKEIAHEFVDGGYSVDWRPDEIPIMSIYHPCFYAQRKTS